MDVRKTNRKTVRKTNRKTVRKKLIVVVFGFAALYLASCASIPGKPGDPLEGSTWQLYAYRKTKPYPGTHITASFKDGQVTGTAGCNSYFASYELNGAEIKIGPAGATLMACSEPEGIMEQEQEILGYLNNAERFKLEDGRLLIISADGEHLTFNPMD